MKRLVRLLPAVLALLLFVPSAWAQETTGNKINKKNLVVKEWNTDARSNNRILDHVTTYNADGKKVEEIEYSRGRQKWRKRFEHDAAGKVSRELVYDEYNKLQTIKKFEYNEFGRKKTQYSYDGKGKLKSIKVFEYITEDA